MKITLQARITDARLTIRERSKLLRRVRSLYFAINRQRLMSDLSHTGLLPWIKRVKAIQLYAETTGESDLYFSIRRKLWRMDVRDGKIGDDLWSWSRWVEQTKQMKDAI